MTELLKTDVIEFMRNLKVFETRMESAIQKLKEQQQNAKN